MNLVPILSFAVASSGESTTSFLVNDAVNEFAD